MSILIRQAQQPGMTYLVLWLWGLVCCRISATVHVQQVSSILYDCYLGLCCYY